MTLFAPNADTQLFEVSEAVRVLEQLARETPIEDVNSLAFLEQIITRLERLTGEP